MAKHVNLEAIATYIACGSPSQLGVLRDMCLAQATRLGISSHRAKPLPPPQAGVTQCNLKVAGFREWVESVGGDDASKQAREQLASVLAALERKLA